MNRKEKFEALEAESRERAAQAKANGASEAVVARILQTADGYRRQALQTRATRRSNTSGRVS